MPPTTRTFPGTATQLRILWLCAALFFLLFTLVGLLIHQNLGTSAHDLGVFDQAYWRYSRLHDTFNTVLGFSILGDHFGVLALLFGPLYAIYPSVAWPIAAQALSVTVAGLVLYDIARIRLPQAPLVALAITLAYYLAPAVHSMLLWQFHEISLAAALYMGLIWSYIQGRRKLLIACLVALLMCREDMPFTVFAFGLFALTDKRWREAAWAIGLALAWWLFATKVAMPLFNGQGYWQAQPGRPLAPLLDNMFNPSFYIAHFSQPQSISYLFQLLFPLGFVALWAPRYLIPALPTLLANVLIGGYKTQIFYHYGISIVPFVFWAATEALSRHQTLLRLSDHRFARAFEVAVIALSVLAYSQFSSLELRRLPQMGQDWSDNAPKREMLAALDREIGNQGIAASDFLLPQLSHRDRIYLFPNPWTVHYWGIAGENPHHPNSVNYIVVSSQMREEQPELFEYLEISGIFRVERDELGIVVLKRIKPEAADRAQAIAQFKAFVPEPGPTLTEIAISPAIATTEEHFRDLQFDLATLQHAAPDNWKPLPEPPPRQPLDLTLDEAGKGDFQSVYVRTVVTRQRAMDARLEIGSDDGVTVWLNGRQVVENIVERGALLGDDQLRLKLQPGRNVILFRVNNALGAWKLIARISRY